MNRNVLIGLGALAVVAIFLVMSSVYTVHMTKQAMVLQFGAPQTVINTPGLHVKMPWQSVQFFDRRVLNLDIPTEEVIAQDKKRLKVDAFARWRITDALRFYQTLNDENTAVVRLTPILSSNVRRVLGSQDFAAVLSDKRDELMRQIRDNVNKESADFGIQVLDVRIRRADLPQENSVAIYRRMQQERVREANEYRAEGAETAQGIRARADREVTVLTADATRQSEILRGEGDAEKTKTLAAAYGRDPEFFAFYRSMRAYQDLLNAGTTVILSPTSDFLKYLGKGPTGR